VVTFYPASGLRNSASGVFTATGSDGHWWSSAVSGISVCHAGFWSVYVNPTHLSTRAYGFPVRCVQNLLLLKKIKSLIWVEGSLTAKKAVTSYPASGFRRASSGVFGSTNIDGRCWLCAVSGASAYDLYFWSSYVYPMSNDSRAYGFGVRCVQYLQSDLCVALKGSSLL
jgi:hypothetical protein